jgi:hypothetical protein
MLHDAVCIVAADSRANSSKGGGAKSPVYRNSHDGGAIGPNDSGNRFE